jgi:DNA-binding winged helix-turn-helix (wHTH) protein
VRNEETNPPTDIRVNLITGDTVLERRNLLYAERADHYVLTCSEDAVAYPEADVYVVPSARISELLKDSYTRLIPTIVYGPADHLRRAYAAGCADFMKDPWTPEELHFRALKLGNRNEITFSGGSLVLGQNALLASTAQVPLSRQERAILGLLVYHQGSCVSRDALSYVSRGIAAGASRAIDMHVSHVRKKIGCLMGDRSGFRIVAVRGFGYMLVSDA